ncbi:hypothetical protein PUN28_015395 [Cardiocondyla obscurior]|uniref:Uncharacterized protein n=1 Tax=Cardiocondyla obscurior TaxID=286306 RepID=A0AAW2EST5_9HYME
MNIEIKASHACVGTSGVSGHLPISDDRLHNIFVNAFTRVPANSIIAARHSMSGICDCPDQNPFNPYINNLLILILPLVFRYVLFPPLPPPLRGGKRKQQGVLPIS